MPEHYTSVEDYLLSSKHRDDLEIESEPEELIDEDWKEGFE